MRVKLTRDVLAVHNTMASRRGDVVDMDDAQAKEFIAAGLGEETKDKPTAQPQPLPADIADGTAPALTGTKEAAQADNKMADAPRNKAAADDAAAQKPAKGSTTGTAKRGAR
jgi:hypothetical protein